MKLYKAIDMDLFGEPNTNVSKFIENNALREYEGVVLDKDLPYGFGAYLTSDLQEAIKSAEKMNNPLIITFALKNKFADFIIFDEEVRSQYQDKEEGLLTPKEMLQKLVPANELKKIDTYIHNCEEIDPEYRKKGLDYFATIAPTGGKQARMIYESLGQTTKQFGLSRIEPDLLKTKIRGYVFNGHLYKKAVVVRDFGSILPAEFSLDRGLTWTQNENLLNEDSFIRVMSKSQFPPFKFCREYPNVSKMHHCSIEGLSYVVKENDEKNYMGSRSGRHFFPIDVSILHTVPFITSNKLRFTINKEDFVLIRGEQYTLYKDDTKISYQRLVSFIKHNCPNKQIYEDNILEDLLGIGF